MYLEKLKTNYLRPDWLINKINALTREAKIYYSPLNLSYYLFLISCLRCYLKEGFAPYEVFQLGLGSSLTANKNIKNYISQKRMDQIGNSLNPQNKKSMVNNKEIFYKICNKLKLPIPQLYAIILKNNESISYLNSSYKCKIIDFVKFIVEELPYEFVIKPTLGSTGRFINVYTKTKKGIIDGFGNLRTEQDILQELFNNDIYQSFIVQERLKNHSYLYKIHPSENLHTIRIITLIDSSGQFKILHAHLNIATGLIIASQRGNLKVAISLNDGSVEYGIYIDKKLGGFKKITKHPGTGKNLTRFNIPFWKEILSITEKAAFEFLPLSTLGWDFAITEKGPKILEANVGYTPPNYFKSIEKFKDEFF